MTIMHQGQVNHMPFEFIQQKHQVESKALFISIRKRSWLNKRIMTLAKQKLTEIRNQAFMLI